MTLKTNDGSIHIASNTHVYVQTASGGKQWSFASDGILTLPQDGDIVDSNGSSVLGGGSGPSDRLVNGSYEVVLGSNGVLTVPDDIFLGQNGRIVKDCNNATGTTSMRWINVPANNNNIELIRIYSGASSGERAQIRMNWLDEYRSGLTIRAFDSTNSGNIVRHNWQFQGNGGLVFPDNTVQTTAFTGLPDLLTESDEAPETGIFWFNTQEARMYVKYNEQWVDASPTVLPPPETNPTFESVTFNDATVQTTAWSGTVSYNDLTDKPVAPTFVGGGGASTWLTPD
mgnify:CR=1 FL=1